MIPLPGREAFALDPSRSLLNHGSFGAVPRAVLQVREREIRALEADPLGWMAAVGGRLRAAAQRVGRFVGARGRDVVFVDNATTGVNTALAAIDWRRGDRILTTSQTYGAVSEAVARTARRHGLVVDVVEIPFPLSGPDEVLDAITPRLPGARAAVLDAVAAPTGLVLPLSDLVAACRAAGVLSIVDAAHAPGLIPLDLEALGADWVTGNLHKWGFAPKGCAVLVAAPCRQRRTEPLVASWDAAAGWPLAFDWPGTRDFTPWVTAPAALDWLKRLGPARVRAHNDALCAEAAARIADRWGVSLPAPSSMLAAMAALPVPGAGAADVVPLHDALRRAGIEVRVVGLGGRAWIRISAQLYNTLDEYDRLAEVTAQWMARRS